MYWIMLSFVLIFFCSKDIDWTSKMISCTPGKNIKTISLLSDPNLKSYGFQESVVTVKTWFFEREKYSYKIGDILIKGYLMLKDALENLPTIYSVCNMQQEVKIYGNIIHDVFSRSKAHGSDGRKPTATDIKNMPSLHDLVRTDQAYKLFKNSSMESQTAALLCVGIGDEIIILQWHLLVIKGD